MIRFLILFFYYYMPVVLYLLFVFFLSSLSLSPPNILILNSDKTLHILEYTILGFLFMRAYLNTAGKEHKIRGVFTTTFFAFLFGCSDEYHQLYVPDRVVSVGDIIADTVGGFIGSIFYIIVLYILLRRERKNVKTN
ncbi:MAG: VanZ family protein [Myxococcota bacterium]